MPRKSKLIPFRNELGIIPDREIADKVGLTSEAVRRYRTRHGIPARWRGEGEALPGEGEILSKASQPKPKASKPARRQARTGRGRKSKLDPYLDELGILPDKALAEKAGVTPENVRAYRIRRGIPARWRGEGEPLVAEQPAALEPEPAAQAPAESQPAAAPPAPPEPAPAESPAPTPSEPARAPSVLLRGYSVTLSGPDGEQEFVAVAADIAQAAIAAVAAVQKRGLSGEVVGLRFLARAIS